MDCSFRKGNAFWGPAVQGSAVMPQFQQRSDAMIQHIPVVATMVLQTSSAVFGAGEQADLGYQSRQGDLK
jgi:hypothetical protein